MSNGFLEVDKHILEIKTSVSGLSCWYSRQDLIHMSEPVDDVVAIFKDHPLLGTPEATIDIVEAGPLVG